MVIRQKMKDKRVIVLLLFLSLILLFIAGCSPEESSYDNPTDSIISAKEDINDADISDRSISIDKNIGRGDTAADKNDENMLTEDDIFPKDDDTDRIRFGIEDIGYDEFGESPSSWFKDKKERGISMVSFDPFNIEEGLTIIDSPALKEMGFTLDPDYSSMLRDIFDAAKEENIALILMIEGLAHAKSGFLNPSESIVKDKITPERVGQFIKELGETARSKKIKIAISEEAFDDEFLPSIALSTREAGIRYIHFFDDLDCSADEVLSEDYGYYFKDLRNSDVDKEQAKRNLAIGSYYGELGFLNIMYGAASACGRDAGTLTAGGWGLGARTHQNIALLRSIQFYPKDFFFVTAEDAEGNMLKGEKEYVSGYDFNRLKKLILSYGRKASDSKKPIANLIIDMPSSQDDTKDYFDNSLLGSVSAVTNSMLAAGFDIEVSKKPLEGADLYYVFGTGMIFEEGKDISDDLLRLRERRVPVFYQLAGEISPDLTPNWNSLMGSMGIEKYTPITDDLGEFEPIPLRTKASFTDGEFEFNYAGYTLEVDDPSRLGSYSLAHTIHLIDPKKTDSDILLTGTVQKDKSGDNTAESALIIKKGDIYFINGNYIHLALLPFLANLMSKEKVFNEPSYIYAATGKDRSVFFTAYPARLDINLQGGSRIVEFDEAGNEISSSFTLDNGRLRGRLEKFHLLVVN